MAKAPRNWASSGRTWFKLADHPVPAGEPAVFFANEDLTTRWLVEKPTKATEHQRGEDGSLLFNADGSEPVTNDVTHDPIWWQPATIV
jgi:hypothetical protein